MDFRWKELTPEERANSPLLYDQRTQATYYKSHRFPEGLTPEFVQGNGPKQRVKNGQVPWPLNRWTPLDTWLPTNNWFHRINDRVGWKSFTGNQTGIHNTEIYDQPYRGHLCYSERKYEDDIVGQTLGAAIIGLQLGFCFGFCHTWNLGQGANIYQTPSMMPNTWMPIAQANYRFRLRVFGSCMIQCSSFLAAYALTDGCCSQLRNKDDGWNPILGGIASGGVLYAWFRNPFMTIPCGLAFGTFMMYFRFMKHPDDLPKPAFDFERPFWGVFGGMRQWLAGLEPTTQDWVWGFWDSKYRTQ